MWWFFNSVTELFLEYFLLSEMILQRWYVIIIDFLKTFCVEIYKYTAKLKKTLSKVSNMNFIPDTVSVVMGAMDFYYSTSECANFCFWLYSHCILNVSK